MHVQVTFPSGHITVELLQTPVVEKWLTVFNRYKKYNIPSVLTGMGICSWGSDWMKRLSNSDKGTNARAEAVKKINQAIDNVNVVIEGKKFPYRAYEGMTWEHTNLIHRCFTTSMLKLDGYRMWQYDLTQEQLKKCKTMDSIEMSHYVYANSESQFKVLDQEKFNWEVGVINHQVHMYEEHSLSAIAEETLHELDWYHSYTPLKERRKNIMWNKEYTYTEDKTCLKPEFAVRDLLETVSHEELISSFPNNLEDYNVFIHKSITGKDYETNYCQYDNGLEADTRNIEHINGNMTICVDNDLYKFSSSDKFNKWAKDYGLRDELFYNVPIGKIVDKTIDVSTEENIESVELI